MAKKDYRDTFLEAWTEFGFDKSYPESEYRFHDSRRWRFDIAFPTLKVAVELDGFGYGHQSIGGRKKDNEKANAAVERGWVILRYTPSELTRTKISETVEQVCRVLMNRGRV